MIEIGGFWPHSRAANGLVPPLRFEAEKAAIRITVGKQIKLFFKKKPGRAAARGRVTKR